MPTTPLLNLPYANPGDPADGAGNEQSMMGATETAILGGFAFKPSPTNRTSATLTNDPDLLFAVVANAFYQFQFWIYYGGPAAGGFKVGLSAPAGSSASVWVDGLSSAVTAAAVGDGTFGAFSLGSAISFGVNSVNTNQLRAIVFGTLSTGGTSGTFVLQTAQTTASGTTIVYDGSQLFIRRIP